MNFLGGAGIRPARCAREPLTKLIEAEKTHKLAGLNAGAAPVADAQRYARTSAANAKPRSR